VPLQNITEINYFREIFSPDRGLPPLLEYYLCVGTLAIGNGWRAIVLMLNKNTKSFIKYDIINIYRESYYRIDGA
jgi:hypothetical protein